MSIKERRMSHSLSVLVCWGLLLGAVTPAAAFVEKLAPNGGPIPCHQMRGAVVLYIKGTYTGGQLANALAALYLTPDGQTWSSTDTTDNANLKALVDGQPTLAAKLLVAIDLESLCAFWEHQPAALDTPAEFRSHLGIAAP
jgi:hypothetical protein